MTTKDQIQADVALALAIEKDELQPNRPLIEYGLDSIRMMEVVVTIEDFFGIEINDVEIGGLKTLEDLHHCVEQKQSAIAIAA